MRINKVIKIAPILFYLAFIALLSNSVAQNKKTCTTKNTECLVDTLTSQCVYQPNKQRLIASSLGLLATNWLLYQPFKDAWWQEERSGFHFYRGYKRSRGYWDFGWNDSLYGHMDKLGHFYSSKMLSELLTDISKWIGFSPEKSRIAGPIASFLFMLEIEIYDSFFKEWGFSLSDMTANALGSFSPILGEKMSYSDRFKLKFSYKPSGHIENSKHYITDYVGMTFWLSYDIEKDWPGKYLPDFLNFAIGYSVDHSSHGQVELYIAPDIDWQALSKNKGPVLSYTFKWLDQFHFPCIAWKLTPGYKFHPLYY